MVTILVASFVFCFLIFSAFLACSLIFWILYFYFCFSTDFLASFFSGDIFGGSTFGSGGLYTVSSFYSSPSIRILMISLSFFISSEFFLSTYETITSNSDWISIFSSLMDFRIVVFVYWCLENKDSSKNLALSSDAWKISKVLAVALLISFTILDSPEMVQAYF